MRMKSLLLHCAWMVTIGLAFCVQAAPHGPPVEASMLIAGTIVIAPDGSVRSHLIDRPEKLPSAIQEVVDEAIASWKFDPIVIDGKPVLARTTVNLRLVVDPVDHGSYAIRIGGVSFSGGDPRADPQPNASANRRYSPTYPSGALRAFAGGTVYLLLKLGREGRVLDAAAEQVNLTVWDSPEKMAKLREDFANAALVAVKRWTFIPPTVGPSVDEPYWYARMPVTFDVSPYRRTASEADEYGHWQPYVRGPRELVAWFDLPQLAADSVDTTPGGSVLALGKGPKLTNTQPGG